MPILRPSIPCVLNIMHGDISIGQTDGWTDSRLASYLWNGFSDRWNDGWMVSGVKRWWYKNELWWPGPKLELTCTHTIPYNKPNNIPYILTPLFTAKWNLRQYSLRFNSTFHSPQNCSRYITYMYINRCLVNDYLAACHSKPHVLHSNLQHRNGSLQGPFYISVLERA